MSGPQHCPCCAVREEPGELEADGVCASSWKAAGWVIDEPLTGAAPCEDTNCLRLLSS